MNKKKTPAKAGRWESAAATERLDPAPPANEQPCFTRKEWRRELKRRPSQPTPAISPRLPSLMRTSVDPPLWPLR
ncbi:hypothetical protein ACO22_05016 [Paracoccidioides brasiliensis]|uniref:Uncharacterized protein n=1 Tax=Paracoccidioides brasiliensis TaxID=121759 RepID=A0A1D2JBI7_PARBR|nr:hypothetical protein ACO22_05016 [Paracoccidioides brasiliensis]